MYVHYLIGGVRRFQQYFFYTRVARIVMGGHDHQWNLPANGGVDGGRALRKPTAYGRRGSRPELGMNLVLRDRIDRLLVIAPTISPTENHCGVFYFLIGVLRLYEVSMSLT